MSKIPAILSATLTVSLAACGGGGGKDHTPVGQTVTTPVVTAEPAPTGTLTVYNSTDGLFITATAAEGWEYTETRLAVATSLDCIPHTKTGAANPSRFMLRRKGKPAATELTYNLPLLVEPGTQLYIALHASARKFQTTVPQNDGQHGDCEDDEPQIVSAWASGELFAGKGSGMYLTFTVQAPSGSSLSGLYRTHPQSAWGSAQANPSTDYLAANFAMAFPGGGVTIGSSTGFTAQFTTSQAVLAFLPQTGTAAALTRNWMNPSNASNAFAGEVLALALNLGFDRSDLAFSAHETALADLVVADPASAYYGLTVADVFASANTLLGGRSDPMGATLTDAFDAVERINANFENGTADLGFLAVP